MRALCRHCSYFLSWVSQYPLSERLSQRQAAHQQAMAAKVPSQKQPHYLAALGYTVSAPVTMLEASERIDALLCGRRVRR